MPRHKGGKVGNAGKVLSNLKSSKPAKTKAAKILNKHKQKNH